MWAEQVGSRAAHMPRPLVSRRGWEGQGSDRTSSILPAVRSRDLPWHDPIDGPLGCCHGGGGREVLPQVLGDSRLT